MIGNSPNFLSWWIIATPKAIWEIGWALVCKTWQFFSVPLLFKTIFEPWKRDILSTKGASLDVIFRVWIANLISRLVGFVVRLGIILTGLVLVILVLAVSISATAGFVLLPVLAVGMMVMGVRQVVF